MFSEMSDNFYERYGLARPCLQREREREKERERERERGGGRKRESVLL